MVSLEYALYRPTLSSYWNGGPRWMRVIREFAGMHIRISEALEKQQKSDYSLPST